MPDTTSADILLDAPFTVTIAGRDIAVKPLPFGEDLEWSKKVGLLAQKAMATIKDIPTENLQSLTSKDILPVVQMLLPFLFGEGLQETRDLFLLMLTPEDRDFVRANANGIEINKAALEVFKEFVFPFFVETMKTLLSLIAPHLNLSQS